MPFFMYEIIDSPLFWKITCNKQHAKCTEHYYYVVKNCIFLQNSLISLSLFHILQLFTMWSKQIMKGSRLLLNFFFQSLRTLLNIHDLQINFFSSFYCYANSSTEFIESKENCVSYISCRDIEGAMFSQDQTLFTFLTL